MFSSEKLKLMLAMVPDAVVADFMRQRADDETATQIISKALDEGNSTPMKRPVALKPRPAAKVKANGGASVLIDSTELVFRSIEKGSHAPKEICADTGLTYTAVARHLAKLRQAKRIRHQGKFRSSRYYLRTAP